jgi:nucleotide-binding universal stress UspA family protein
MTRKILCATDGTDHSSIAVIQAAELSAKTGAALTICTVNVAHGGGRGPMINHWSDAEVETILNDAVALAEKHGGKSVERVTLRSREAAGGVVAYAETNGFDHIVMGTGDKRGISRLVLGSVAGEVAGRAHCSVTVAR